jgi:isopenicillin-N epimerase
MLELILVKTRPHYILCNQIQSTNPLLQIFLAPKMTTNHHPEAFCLINWYNRPRRKTMHKSYRQLFLIDPQIHFLNHGSFGACPRPVFAAYQAWQRMLEDQPVLFLGRDLPHYDQLARQALAAYLNVPADHVAYVPNATYAVNLVARSLHLQPGDEVLTSNHEYGACDYTWEFICEKSGASYRHHPIPLPATSPENIAEQFLAAIRPNTRLIFLSHITSPTALTLPVQQICARARAAGILTFIDGAHAPGQIPLDLSTLQADFYTGNCHKWMLSPKGAGFLYATPSAQSMLEPLVVSWGYKATPQTTTGSRFIDIMQWTGTHDPSPALTVPSAIEFMQINNWPEVAKECQALLQQTLHDLSTLTGLPSIYPDPNSLTQQMGSALLPSNTNINLLKNRLYEEYKVEVPLIEWQNLKLLRVSIQAYNTTADTQALLDALQTLLPQVQSS